MTGGAGANRVTDHVRGTIWTTRTLILAYIGIGVGLTLQPDRFANTPSYHNLLVFAPASAWGCAYIAVAALLVAWRLAPRTEWLNVVAHTGALILTLWWFGAFIIRYATDDGTTIVNIVSWGVFLSLIARSWSSHDGLRHDADDAGGGTCRP